jgi:hypothetical protein
MFSANGLFVGIRPDSFGGADDDALPVWKAHILNLVSDINIQWNFSIPDPQKTGPPWIPANFLIKSLLNNSLQKKSHKTGHPSKSANFFGPSAGRFREVSLYLQISWWRERIGLLNDWFMGTLTNLK